MSRPQTEAEYLARFPAAPVSGFSRRTLLGGDVARATRYRGYGGMPGLAYLGERVLPRLTRETSPSVLRRALETNPARWLAGVRSEPTQGEHG